jgi:hypothetical protein
VRHWTTSERRRARRSAGRSGGRVEPKEANADHHAVAAMLAAGVRVWTPNLDTMIETAAPATGDRD